MDYLETTLKIYHCSLRNNPEQRISHYDIRLCQFVIVGFIKLSGCEKKYPNKSISISSLAIRVFVSTGTIM
jgi:hypothetical protein